MLQINKVPAILNMDWDLNGQQQKKKSDKN